MGKYNKAEYAKMFSESVDNMLKGERVSLRAGVGDEYCEVLAVAEWLAKRRINARPEFKAALRSRLLSQLNQEEAGMSYRQENSGFWGVLKRFMPRHPLWQTVTALAVVALIGVIVWSNITPPATPEPTTPVEPMQVAPVMPLLVEATADHESYMPGEEITIELTLTNAGSEVITISPILPEMEIISSGKQEVVRYFAPGSEHLQMEAGKTLTKNLVWDQKDSNRQQVPPGYYQVSVGEIRIEGAESGATGTKPGSILEILIQSPQGTALERTIDVNETVSANGFAITLMRVESSTTGIKVYAMATIDESSAQMPAMPAIPTSPMMVAQAFAQYSVDGSEPKQVIGTGKDPVEGGVGLYWSNLDPIPVDAKVLTFIITSLDEQQGPWDFEIPLQ